MGLLRKFENSLAAAAKENTEAAVARRVRIPCGTSIAPVMERWVAQYGPAGVSVTVQPIRNTFFGETVTVTGLITGGDLISQLKDADEDEILLCGNTLREQGDKFLDDVTLEQVRAALKPRLTVVPNTGADLFRALIGKK